jgi:hypothetical protein
MALVFCTFAVLTACSGDSGESAPRSAADDAGMTEEEVARYQEKVSRTVSRKVGGAMVNAMVEDWGISRDQAECLLRDPRVTELERLFAGDPEMQVVFNDCGVDPAVVK